MDGSTVPRGNHVSVAWANISISADLQARASRGELLSINLNSRFVIYDSWLRPLLFLWVIKMSFNLHSTFTLEFICNFLNGRWSSQLQWSEIMLEIMLGLSGEQQLLNKKNMDGQSWRRWKWIKNQTFTCILLVQLIKAQLNSCYPLSFTLCRCYLDMISGQFWNTFAGLQRWLWIVPQFYIRLDGRIMFIV